MALGQNLKPSEQEMFKWLKETGQKKNSSKLKKDEEANIDESMADKSPKKQTSP